MSTPLILSIVSFAIGLLFALVVGGWREAIIAAWPGSPAEVEGTSDELVSLIVPARDAADTLSPLLQDLHAQQWPRDRIEVIVVDDGSTDRTADIVREMQKRWSGLVLINAVGAGKKAALSQGVEQARGEWMVITDADARCGPLRVKRIMEYVLGREVDMLLMPVETSSSGGVIQRIQADEQTALLGVAAGTALQGRPMLANGANMAFRRSAFKALGGYSDDTWASGDDMFLLKRMLKNGRNVAYLLHPDVVVTVEAEQTFRDFWEQRLRWAGKMRAMGGSGGWLALAGLLFPWFLLYVSLSFTLLEVMLQRPLAILLMLSSAWLLWLLPILALSRSARHLLQTTASRPARRGANVTTVFSLFAFSIYAPVIAVASLFVRPRWKGRKI